MNWLRGETPAADVSSAERQGYASPRSVQYQTQAELDADGAEGLPPSDSDADRLKHSKRRELTVEDYVAVVLNAKVKAGCKILENGKVCIEENSVYGAAILLPQIARSFGYPLDLTIKAVRAYIYLLLSVMIVCYLLLFMSKEENVIDNFAGQMFLCDFGVAFATEEGPGGMGPGGTDITAARMYSFNDWTTRKFIRDSLKILFPKEADRIDEVVDPGEYGVESHWCRLLCCFVFMLSITQELDLLSNMAKLLYHIPTVNEPWVILNDHDVNDSADRWLNHMTIKVAGMSRGWKIFNLLVVLCPKAFVFYLTANTGTTFLMESSGIDDVIVNSVALGFLLTLDDLITTSIQSASVKHFLTRCEGFELYDVAEGVNLQEDDVVELYISKEKTTTKHSLLTVIPQKLVVVFGFCVGFVLKYYVQHCDVVEGRWVSKTMYLPVSVSWDLIKAVFPGFVVTEEEPYWTMPK